MSVACTTLPHINEKLGRTHGESHRGSLGCHFPYITARRQSTAVGH